MMKESKKSLKAYFIIVGVLGILSSIGPIAAPVAVIIRLFTAIDLIMSIAFLYFGIKFYYYLQNSPKTLNNFVMVYFGIRSLTDLITGQWFDLVLSIVVGYLLLGRYMIRSVNRLSSEMSIDTKK